MEKENNEKSKSTPKRIMDKTSGQITPSKNVKEIPVTCVAKLSKPELFIQSEKDDFQTRISNKEHACISHLFCSRCGGFKPYCECNSFKIQMEFIYGNRKL